MFGVRFVRFRRDNVFDHGNVRHISKRLDMRYWLQLFYGAIWSLSSYHLESHPNARSALGAVLCKGATTVGFADALHQRETQTRRPGTRGRAPGVFIKRLESLGVFPWSKLW